MTDRLLNTMDETAQRLGVGRTTTYDIAGRGELEIVHIGRRALVTETSLRAYVERLRGAITGGEAA